MEYSSDYASDIVNDWFDSSYVRLDGGTIPSVSIPHSHSLDGKIYSKVAENERYLLTNIKILLDISEEDMMDINILRSKMRDAIINKIIE